MTNSPADTKVSKEAGRRHTPGARADILMQPVRKTMVKQVVPVHPMEEHGGTHILQPMEEPMMQQVP